MRVGRKRYGQFFLKLLFQPIAVRGHTPHPSAIVDAFLGPPLIVSALHIRPALRRAADHGFQVQCGIRRDCPFLSENLTKLIARQSERPSNARL